MKKKKYFVVIALLLTLIVLVLFFSPLRTHLTKTGGQQPLPTEENRTKASKFYLNNENPRPEPEEVVVEDSLGSFDLTKLDQEEDNLLAKVRSTSTDLGNARSFTTKGDLLGKISTFSESLLGENFSAEQFAATLKKDLSSGQSWLGLSTDTETFYFDAKGELVSFSLANYPLDSVNLPADQVREKALNYAQAFGMPDNYKLKDEISTDDGYYSFCFYPEIEPGVFSEADNYRVGVSANKGELCMISSWSYPLEIPEVANRLTVDKAFAIAKAELSDYFKGGESFSGQLTAVRPNYFFKAMQDGTVYMPAPYSRLVWQVKSGQTIAYVDAQSGEILGGDILPNGTGR